MDMVVANLLKRKINFRLTREENCYCEKKLQYTSMLINKLNIGVRHTHWVYMNSIRPFIVHFISTFVTEESERIDYISVYVEWWILREGVDIFRDTIMTMSLNNPKVGIQQFPSNTYPTIYSVPEPEMNESFKIKVVFRIGMPTIRPDRRRPSMEEESDVSDDEEEPYTPPVETYRQDCCVVCLESKPNILYLDCMHIAICDSCDRLKKTNRYNCDVCRSEISKRVKI